MSFCLVVSVCRTNLDNQRDFVPGNPCCFPVFFPCLFVLLQNFRILFHDVPLVLQYFFHHILICYDVVSFHFNISLKLNKAFEEEAFEIRSSAYILAPMICFPICSIRSGDRKQ